MKKGMMIGCGVVGAIGIVVLIAVMWFVGIYNEIVTLEENVTGKWSQVENQYQRRADLIPNLVNTVKGVADFEKETYTAVADARAKVGQVNLSADQLDNAAAFNKFQKAQKNLSGALSRLLVAVERYPQLKANENFMQLQAQLEGTENRISVERMKFNESVQAFNTKIKRFPGKMIAGFAGFSPKQYFEADEGSEEAPKVEF